MTLRPLCVTCLLLLLRPAAAEDAAARLELSAEPPVVPVTATAPGRRFIELPALEYRFAVQTACGGNRSPRSLSISIADSRLALSDAELEKHPREELVLNVPARQLAPIAVDDFCVTSPVAIDADPGKPAGERDPAPPGAASPAPRNLLTVPAVVSAQASLVCGGADGDEISYVTQPLAVTLACMAPAGSVADPPAGPAGNR